MKKYEYHKIETTSLANEFGAGHFNMLGDEGWELVCVFYQNERYHAWFKREINAKLSTP